MKELTSVGKAVLGSLVKQPEIDQNASNTNGSSFLEHKLGHLTVKITADSNVLGKTE